MKSAAVIAVASLLLFACGPMNGPPPVTSSQLSEIKSAGKTAVSKENHYYVFTSAATMQASTELHSQGGAGEYTYVVRFVHTADLHLPSANAKVTAEYYMPSMPEMGTETEAASRQSDGAFSVKLIIPHGGLWEIKLTLEDGDIRDEYVFQVAF